MKKKQMIGLVVAAALFIVTGVSSVFTNRLAEKTTMMDTVAEVLTGGYTFDAPTSDYVAVVKVEGTIQEQTETGFFETVSQQEYQHSTTMEYIDYLMSDLNNVGILLYVDSPGGAVYESEELYLKLKEYKETTGRPIWDYMAHYAASGGYYVSVAADKIYANPNTVTGSIGVIMAGYDMSGLYEKLGIRYISITSGVNKDSTKMTDEQISIYQSQVDEAYEQFVSIVAEGRGMDIQTVKALADGRTYSAKQAVENGLVDEIGLYEDVVEMIADEAGTDILYEMEAPQSTFAELFSSVKSAIPKSEAQVLEELAGETHGGLQYYAEGLR